MGEDEGREEVDGEGGVGGWYQPCVLGVEYWPYWDQYWLKSDRLVCCSLIGLYSVFKAMPGDEEYGRVEGGELAG